MEHRQRQLIAALVLALSIPVVAYLLFFSPSESNVNAPTPTLAPSESTPISGVQVRESLRTSGRLDGALLLQTQSDSDEGDDLRSPAKMPSWMVEMEFEPEHVDCPSDPKRIVEVGTAEQLQSALENAKAGDRISLASGVYAGNFEILASGEENEMIWICGPRDAVIDAGGVKNGYGLHITGSHVGVWGLTVRNAQKGIMVDGGDFVRIDSVEVHTIGDEAVHFRGHATDGVVHDSLIHHTGLRRDKIGEGIYVGTAVSNWEKITDGEPDRSDRISILRNRIWDTSSESIDRKEGTTSGIVEGNAFDGSSLTGADSWVDVKGNDYVLRGNVGVNSPEDGFQTHNIDDMGWGRNNQFLDNTAQVSGAGFGFYIHDPEETMNIVSCTNEVVAAEAGFANVECVDPA